MRHRPQKAFSQKSHSSEVFSGSSVFKQQLAAVLLSPSYAFCKTASSVSENVVPGMVNSKMGSKCEVSDENVKTLRQHHDFTAGKCTIAIYKVNSVMNYLALYPVNEQLRLP